VALVAEEEPAGDLVRPPGPQGVEPVHQLLVMPGRWPINEKLEMVQEQVVLQQHPHRRRVVPAEDAPDHLVHILRVLLVDLVHGQGVQLEAPAATLQAAEARVGAGLAVGAWRALHHARSKDHEEEQKHCPLGTGGGRSHIQLQRLISYSLVPTLLF